MERKHTPGPWKFHANGDANDYSILGPNNNWVIAFIQNGEIWTEQQLANAKLIAAAPDMLEALVKWINYFESNPEDQNANKEFDIYWSTHELLKKLKE